MKLHLQLIYTHLPSAQMEQTILNNTSREKKLLGFLKGVPNPIEFMGWKSLLPPTRDQIIV